MMNIHQAVVSGNNDLVQQILANDPAQVNQILELKRASKIRKVTPIFLAVIAGQVETVKLLLEQGASTETPNGDERLSDWAIMSNARRKVCKILNRHFERTQKPIPKITIDQFKESCDGLNEMLLAHGFHVNHIKDDFNYWLWLGEDGTVEVVKRFLEYYDSGHIPLTIYLGALEKNNRAVIDYLESDYNCGPNSLVQDGGWDGFNLPALVATAGLVKVFPILENLGCNFRDPIRIDYDGDTLSYVATISGQLAVLKYFKEKGLFDVDSTTHFGKNDGVTLAYVAASCGYVDIVQYFHELGYDVKAAITVGECKGNTLAFTASSEGYVRVLKYLHEMGCDLISPIEFGENEGKTLAFMAARSGQVQVLEFLKEIGCDTNAPLKSGKYEGQTPAFMAARSDQVQALEFFQEIGCDTNAPLKSGKYEGQTSAFMAASLNRVKSLRFLSKNYPNWNDPLSFGDSAGDTLASTAALNGNLEALQFLHEKDCDLKSPIKNGCSEGYTPALFAVDESEAEVLEYLASIDININETACSGKYKGLTPFAIAIARADIDVMKVYYEHGYDLQSGFALASMHMRAHNESLERKSDWDIFNALQELGVDLDLPIDGKIHSEISGLKKLSAKELVAIIYYQLQVREEWFKENKQRFKREMERISVEDWVQGRSLAEIHLLLKMYDQCGGKGQEWFQKALLAMIDLVSSFTQEEVNEVFKYVDPSQFQIEDLIDAVKPGVLLLELLKRLSLAEVSYRPDQLMHLEQWVSRLLKESAGDEEFWTLSRDYLKAIRQKVAKPVHRGKGRGPQVKKDVLETLWSKFDKKIFETNSKPEVLQAIISARHQEVNDQCADLLKDNETFVKKLETKWTVSTPSDQDDLLKNQKIQEFLNDLFHESQLQEEDKFLQHDFKDFKKVATLEVEVSKIASEVIASAKETFIAFQRRISDREKILEVELVTLENERAFRQLQRKMQQEPRPVSLLRPYKNIEKRFQAREEVVWEDHEKAIAQANSVQELKAILQETESRISELGQSLIAEIVVRLQEVVPVKKTRMQRIDEYKDQKILEQKQENDRLLLEIERLKLSALRAPSPEKIIPVVEAPLLDRLIKKLEQIAFISKPAQDALKMINLRGDILTKVAEIEKFLALFDITYDRTKGSHSTYTDGQTNVVIADHDGDSKDYQIKAALEAVYEKLTTKK